MIVLIETLWNVKEFKAIYPLAAPTGFNRNIVECKVVFRLFVVAHCSGFNRNIVECKDSKTFIEAFSELVLIETLWNVKQITF